MKTKHTINNFGLHDWLNQTEVEYAGAYGKGEDKSLKVNLNGNFRVYHHKKLVWEGNQSEIAIEKYNEL